METITFEWDDGRTSYESFRNNTEFYKYMDQMKEDGHYPVSMMTDGMELIGDGYDDADGKRINIETPSW